MAATAAAGRERPCEDAAEGGGRDARVPHRLQLGMGGGPPLVGIRGRAEEDAVAVEPQPRGRLDGRAQLRAGSGGGHSGRNNPCRRSRREGRWRRLCRHEYQFGWGGMKRRKVGLGMGCRLQ